MVIPMESLKSASLLMVLHFHLSWDQFIPLQRNQENQMSQIIVTKFSQNNLKPHYPKIIFYKVQISISPSPLFQAQNALVLEGEFANYRGGDFRQILKSTECLFLEEQQRQ